MNIKKCTETIHYGTFSFVGCLTISVRCDNCGNIVTEDEVRQAYAKAAEGIGQELVTVHFPQLSEEDKLQ